jgi:hypothetical protein
VKSDLVSTKREASKRARREGKRRLTLEEQELYREALRKSVRVVAKGKRPTTPSEGGA